MKPTDRRQLALVLGLLVVGWAPSFAAQIPETAGTITIDGRLDEAEWRDARTVRLVQLVPVAGANASEASEVLLIHDGDALYAAARFADSEPDLIRANRLERDETTGDDLFGLVIDSFNDNKTALGFYTNPEGTRIDEAISNDGEFNGSNPMNRNWNTFWESAARRTPEGWEAELRIPFSSLRFRSDGGKVVMGFTCFRVISRKSEVAVYPPMDGVRRNSQRRPSLAEDYELVGVANARQLLVTPYVLTGMNRHTEVPDEKSVTAVPALGYGVVESQDAQAGLDLKWGLSSDLTLDLTVNTDFSQVEADDALVNLSRFSLFRPEKRLFFQEQAGVFEFGTGGVSQLFYSRRIGIDEDGAPVRIIAGARVVGRVGGWDLGVLDMQTEGNDVMPAENLGVARVRRQIFNSSSYVGGIITSRIGDDGGSNTAYGLDSVLRFSTGDELILRWAQTFDTDPGEPTVGGLDSGRFFASMQRRNRQGWGYTAEAGWSGPDYRPELGFSAREGYRRLYGELRHGWLPEGKSFRAASTWLDGGSYWRLEDGELDSGHLGFGGNIQTDGGTWMWLDLRAFRENLVEEFELGDGVEVPDGQYRWIGLEGGFNLPQGRNIRMWGRGYLGQFYDGQRFFARMGPEWTMSRHFTSSLMYEFNAIRFPERFDELFIHVAQLRLQWSFNSRISADLLTQFSSVDQLVASNLRFRYNLREGTDLYVVLSESMLTNTLQEGLTLPRSDARSLVVKYTHTWSL